MSSGGEVAGVEEVELGGGRVFRVGLGAGDGELLVVSAPGQQRRRLVIAQVLLPGRVERDVLLGCDEVVAVAEPVDQLLVLR